MKSTSVQRRLMLQLEKLGRSDAENARIAGFSAPQFSQYKSGKRCAEDDAIVTLAEMLGENPEEAVRQHRAEQAKTPEMRQFWLSFGKAAAAIMIAIGLSSALLPSDAFATPTLPGKPDVLKIMRSHGCASQGCLLTPSLGLAIHMFVRYGSGR